MTKRILIVLALLVASCGAARGQANCSTGTYNYGDNYNPPDCTNLILPTTLNTVWIRTATEACNATMGANMPPGTVYWNATSTENGHGQKRCYSPPFGSKDCPPRMVFYETDGGQKYPNGTTSDTSYNRFFNQSYDHNYSILSDSCYEVSGNPGQDFQQCPTQLCQAPGGGGGCVTDEPDNDRPTSMLHRPRLMFVQDADDTGCVSPILIDVSGQGFSLTSAQGGVLFDMTATGNRVQMSWTAAGAQNGFLCLPDANGNCNTGKQLFTNFTAQPSLTSKTGKLAANGFNALSVYDQPANGGNGNGEIDSGDAIFSSLRVWIDANHDGLTQPNELFTLGQLGIRSISLNYQWDKKMDQYGNVFRYHASVGRTTGPGRTAYDVFFVWIPGTTTTTTTAQVCPARLLLPTEKATLR